MSALNNFYTTIHPRLLTGSALASSAMSSSTFPLWSGFSRHSVCVSNDECENTQLNSMCQTFERPQACTQLTVDVYVNENNDKLDLLSESDLRDQSVALPSLLFVHGLSSNRSIFYSSAMRAKELGFSIATMSLRGHAESSDVNHINPSMDDDSDLSVSQFSIDVLRVLKHLSGIWKNSPTICVGHSYGGNVVLNLASLEGVDALLAGIVCVDGGYIHLQRKYQTLESCCRALAPPNLAKFSHKSFVHMIRYEWLQGCEEEVVSSMLRNFLFREDGSVTSRVSLQTHMALLKNLYENPPRFDNIQVPVLLIPAGNGGETVFSCSVRDDIDRALAVLKEQCVPCQVEWFAESSHDIPSRHGVQLVNAIYNSICLGHFKRVL